MINNKTNDLCLVVTERCNLNCSYCQSNKTFSNNMSLNCAKSYINRYIELSTQEKLSITFLGGEPFIEFDLIRNILSYTSEAYPDKKIHFTIVTNGTLVHGEKQKWIKENESRLQIILSLDGLEEDHNKNRCNSFQLIDLKFFQSLKKPIVNSVFTPLTIKNMSKNTIELHNLNFFIKGFIADGESWNINHVHTIAQQLNQLIDFYLTNSHVYPISLLTMPIYNLTTGVNINRCGTDSFFEVSISADGKEYACHRCTPFENSGTWKISDKYLNLTNARYLLSDCESCFLDKICNACPASNASLKDNKELSLINCLIRRTLFKANAYFALKMLMSKIEYAGIRHLSDQKKYHLALSSKKILEED